MLDTQVWYRIEILYVGIFYDFKNYNCDGWKSQYIPLEIIGHWEILCKNITDYRWCFVLKYVYKYIDISKSVFYNFMLIRLTYIYIILMNLNNHYKILFG